MLDICLSSKLGLLEQKGHQGRLHTRYLPCDGFRPDD